VAECCRVLRTNLTFSAAAHQLKTLVICSANAREGKTTTVMYLGISIAQTGKRVLVIDTDMRRPRLHIATRVSREPGLSNLMLGSEDYDDVIKPTEVPNLFVLPCGPLPPNPAELLMSQRFKDVLARLGTMFDILILDSPPLQPVTDAVLLAKRADGVVLVARSNRTIRDELRRSARMIRTVGGTIFGVVVNELDRHERDSYYYYSYYGYGQEKPGKGKPDKSAPEPTAGAN
jgi:capsular exopolysaccharide synthesis family protein